MLAKKCLFVGIFTLLSLSLAIAAPPAVHPTTGEPLVITCLRGTPGAIDGDLSDWNLAAMTPAVLDTAGQLYTGQASWASPEDCSGEFYLLWDNEKIYIAVVVKDDKLSMNKSAGTIWNADCVEVFFSTTDTVATHTATVHYQYGFNANNQKWNWCNMDGAGAREPDYLQTASTKTGDGYICEVSIEYGRMLSLNFTAGNAIGFHPCIDDTDDGDREVQMTWTSRDAHNQSLGFGHVLLSATAIGDVNARAGRPSPTNGAMISQTWTQILWKPGPYAVSHDLYIGDNFDDVNAGAASAFWGNLATDSLLVGFPGYPYPDGLVPGTTYYWRIDEVNDAHAASPWKGNVWSFSVAPRTAYNPNPADGDEAVALDAKLTWTRGYAAKLDTVYFGDNFDDVNNATGGTFAGTTTYNPGPLKPAKVYYWRVDETDPPTTYKGQVWSFTTLGAVGNPYPANGAGSTEMNAILSWTPGDDAASHQLYFGMDKEAVRKANTASPEYKGARALGTESYDPGLLAWDSAFYWRIDEVNAVNPNSPWKGPLWSFTTGDFLLVDGFESYNDLNEGEPGSNRIYLTWIDGFGTTTNGAVVGNLDVPITERIVVHDGVQSMPLTYDNNFKYSEATMTLTGAARNWRAQGVTELSLWFAGKAANAAERMYVALNGTAVVYHDNPNAVQIDRWTQWLIPLQAFADLGVNLSNVNSISLGFGTRGNTNLPGGTGQMYMDDIRLCRPTITP